MSFRGHHSTYSGPNKGRTQAGANQVPGRSELQNQAGSVPSTQPSTRHPCPLPSESPAAASAALAEWQLSTPHAPHLPGSALTPRQPGCRKGAAGRWADQELLPPPLPNTPGRRKIPEVQGVQPPSGCWSQGCGQVAWALFVLTFQNEHSDQRPEAQLGTELWTASHSRCNGMACQPPSEGPREFGSLRLEGPCPH